VDDGLVYDYLATRLGDLRAFGTEVARWLTGEGA
jgi:hypothetical protein